MHYVWERGESAGIENVSDYVTAEKVNAWKPGDIILISAPTGSGKTYFVKHTLRDYLIKNSLRCLYLLPRVRIKDQFQQELPNDATKHIRPSTQGRDLARPPILPSMTCL